MWRARVISFCKAIAFGYEANCRAGQVALSGFVLARDVPVAYNVVHELFACKRYAVKLHGLPRFVQSGPIYKQGFVDVAVYAYRIASLLN